jgi:hypothetical protein
MAEIQGYLRELTHQAGQPVNYQMNTDQASLPLTAAIGQHVRIDFLAEKACIHCGRKVRKLYQNGYCFPCVTSLAECDLCIVKPHECHHHLGTCRDPEWAEGHCMIPHYVYLAISSSVKVGLTRKGREYIRWVDQGAVAAILFAEVPTRKHAGELEMELARHIPDKTNWRKMLLDDVEEVDLEALRSQLRQQVDERWRPYLLHDGQVQHFSYPRQEGAEIRLTSLSLDKTPCVEGKLVGVKGQYLLFSHGVFQVKKHCGYKVQISLS